MSQAAFLLLFIFLLFACPLAMTSASTRTAEFHQLVPELSKPDRYGQKHPIETPELLRTKLDEFDDLLTLLPPSQKTHVLAAEKKAPALLTSEFKLLFLRCDVFNVDAAVSRYCNYWEKRVQIFGEQRAFLPLTVDNMQEDLDALYKGVCAVVERDDERNYVYLNPAQMDKSAYSTLSLVRSLWYFMHAALADDPEVQRKGLIFVDFAKHAKFKDGDPIFVKHMIESFKNCMPARFSAYHWCHPPTFVKYVWPMVVKFMGRRLRQRVRIHTRNAVKQLCNDFDFDATELPAEMGGKRKIDVSSWLEQRRCEGK